MNSPINFILNDESVGGDFPPAMTVLDLLRKEFSLFGTKEGCREGECGACTVIIGRPSSEDAAAPPVYAAVPSCLLAAQQIDGCHVVTIEGLDTGICNPLQQAFVDTGGSQCGFCTPGFIMALTGHFISGAEVSTESAMNAIDGNICRCTGYESIRRAVSATVENCRLAGTKGDIAHLVKENLLPSYFSRIPGMLNKLKKSLNTESSPEDRNVFGASDPVIAGGTDLYIQQGDALLEKKIRFLIPGAEAVKKTEEGFFIPGTATMEQLRIHPELNRAFPGLSDKLLVVASSILRNRATVAGNVMNASPIADTAILLLAWNATVRLKNSTSGSVRELPLEKLYLGYKELDVNPGEIIEGFSIPEPQGSWGFNKVSKREHLDIASCNSALCLTTEDTIITRFRFAVGGVAPYPCLARNTAASVTGKPVTSKLLLDSLAVLKGEIAPIDDVRGSAEYKTQLALRLLSDHYLSIFPQNLTFEHLQEGALL